MSVNISLFLCNSKFRITLEIYSDKRTPLTFIHCVVLEECDIKIGARGK